MFGHAGELDGSLVVAVLELFSPDGGALVHLPGHDRLVPLGADLLGPEREGQ